MIAITASASRIERASSNAAFIDRHDKIVADIISTIEQCENPETPEEAADLIGFARLLMDDREGTMLDEDRKNPLRMLLYKASRGRWWGSRPSTTSDRQATMLSAFQGLEGTIRDLTVLARVAADKTIELSVDHASLSPEELEVERRNINDAMSLVSSGKLRRWRDDSTRLGVQSHDRHPRDGCRQAVY